MPTTYYYTVNDEIIGEHTLGQSRLDYLTDALGSVVTTTDQSQNVTSTARYKPYGDDLAVTGSRPAHGWNGMSGYRRTGRPQAQSYVRNRIMSTTCGRWTTVDPLWPGETAYIYAYASPILVTDPTGLSACMGDPCKKCRDQQDNGFPTSWPSNWYNAILDAWLTYCPKTCPNLNPSKFICQIKAESNGNPHEPSPPTAREVNLGLFQISVEIWDRDGCKEKFGPFIPGVFDPIKNIRCAIMSMCKSPIRRGSRRNFHCSQSSWGTHTGKDTPYDCCMRCP